MPQVVPVLQTTFNGISTENPERKFFFEIFHYLINNASLIRVLS